MDHPEAGAEQPRRRRRRGRRRRVAPQPQGIAQAEPDSAATTAPTTPAAGTAPAPEPSISNGGLRVRLRAGILAFLSRHPETQVPTLLDGLRRTVPRFTRTEEVAALEVLHEMVTANLVLPALDRGHLGWPWVRLTDYGRQVIKHGRPVPFDPDQYLAAAEQRLPSVDPLALEIVRESVAAYHHGFVRASALLLGTASELLVLQLVEAFAASRPERERKRLEQQFGDKSMYARYRIFRDEMERARPHLGLPDPLSKDIDAIIDLVFNAVRLNRNEAGHPTGTPLNVTLVATTLQAFLEYAERIAQLIGFFKEPANKPRRARRRRRARGAEAAEASAARAS